VNPLVPQAIRGRVQPGSGIAVFAADGVLWHGDLAADFALWMIGEGHFDGRLWPVYTARNARDPASGSAQMLRFYEGHQPRRMRAHVARYWQVMPERRWLMAVRTTLQWLRQHRLPIYVVSSAASVLLEPLARSLPADRVLGRELAVDAAGRYTGEAAEREDARESVASRLAQLAAAPVQVAASCSALDLPMLRLSQGVSWAVNPDAELTEVAQREGWLLTTEPEE